MSHDEMPDLLPGYAFDALDDVETARVKEHLRVCMPCQLSAESDRAVVENLAYAVPPEHPSPRVKELLMERIATESAGLPSRAPAGWSASGLRGRLRAAPGWLVAAAVVPWIALLGLGATFMMSQQRTPAQQLTVKSLRGPHGEFGHLVMVPGSSSAVLDLMRMPALPAGQRYACWLERHGRMEHVANFTLMPHSHAASVMLHAPHPMSSYAGLDISMEASPHPVWPSNVLLASSHW